MFCSLIICKTKLRLLVSGRSSAFPDSFLRCPKIVTEAQIFLYFRYESQNSNNLRLNKRIIPLMRVSILIRFLKGMENSAERVDDFERSFEADEFIRGLSNKY